jgi:hypothetical protein
MGNIIESMQDKEAKFQVAQAQIRAAQVKAGGDIRVAELTARLQKQSPARFAVEQTMKALAEAKGDSVTADGLTTEGVDMEPLLQLAINALYALYSHSGLSPEEAQALTGYVGPKEEGEGEGEDKPPKG